MKRGHIYHVYHRRNGTYRFVIENSLKLLLTIAIIVGVVYLINEYVLDLSVITTYITEHYNKPTVLAIFYLSEATLGLLAPELYIGWIQSLDYKWIWLALIALISYAGGVTAYFLGTKLHKLPRIHTWVDIKFAQQFHQIKKFGGLLIVIAALTPLPYSPICIISGVIDYPFKRFLILVMSRFVRIALYGAVLFKIL